MAVNAGLSPRGWTHAWLWVGVLVAVGSAFSLPRYVLAHRSQFWPAARGTVTRVETPVAYDRFGRPTTLRFLQVEYTYTVGGRTFTGSRIAFGMDKTLGPRALERVLRPYAVGREVKVYYNPSDPAASFLEPGLKPTQRGLAWVGVLSFFAGTFAAVLAARRLRRMPQ